MRWGACVVCVREAGTACAASKQSPPLGGGTREGKVRVERRPWPPLSGLSLSLWFRGCPHPASDRGIPPDFLPKTRLALSGTA